MAGFGRIGWDDDGDDGGAPDVAWPEPEDEPEDEPQDEDEPEDEKEPEDEDGLEDDGTDEDPSDETGGWEDRGTSLTPYPWGLICCFPAWPWTSPGNVGAGWIGITGPADTGGSSGTSIAPDLPLSISSVPAVIAASVGSDARPTSMATISTYRRVGPEKPSAR
jgi:hypothetical protein